MVVERMLERPHDSVVVLAPEGAGVRLRNRRVDRSRAVCTAPRLIALLCLVILVQLLGLTLLMVDRLRLEGEQVEEVEEQGEGSLLEGLLGSGEGPMDYYAGWEEGNVTGLVNMSDMSDMSDMEKMMFSMKPRCFSMCEPTELFFRFQVR